MTNLTPLQKLARSHGIQTSFIDNSGKRQIASDETLKLILERLGVESRREPDKGLEPVMVSWQRSKASLKIRVAEKPRRIVLRLQDSDEERSIRNFRICEPRGASLEVELPVS